MTESVLAPAFVGVIHDRTASPPFRPEGGSETGALEHGCLDAPRTPDVTAASSLQLRIAGRGLWWCRQTIARLAGDWVRSQGDRLPPGG